MNFRPYFSEWTREVDRFLDNYFNKRAREVDYATPIAQELTRDILSFLKGGKRLRAGLVKLGYELSGGKSVKRVLPIAAATEVLHGAFLIHDDIIDRGEVRHGRETVHIKYQNLLDNRKRDNAHFGESMGIVVGDIAFFETSRLIIESNLSPEIKNRVLGEMTNVALDTGYGEALDVKLSNFPKITQRDVLKIHELKTAFYTFIGPLAYGAIAAGANSAVLGAIREYGFPIGIAFQLQDDILGMFGDEKTLGKPVTSDMKEGKNTLLYLEAKKRGTNKEKIILARVWGNSNVTNKEVRQVRDIIKKTGALDHSINMARHLVKQGKKAIPRLSQNPKYREILITLADYIITRER